MLSRRVDFLSSFFFSISVLRSHSLHCHRGIKCYSKFQVFCNCFACCSNALFACLLIKEPKVNEKSSVGDCCSQHWQIPMSDIHDGDDVEMLTMVDTGKTFKRPLQFMMSTFFCTPLNLSPNALLHFVCISFSSRFFFFFHILLLFHSIFSWSSYPIWSFSSLSAHNVVVLLIMRKYYSFISVCYDVTMKSTLTTTMASVFCANLINFHNSLYPHLLRCCAMMWSKLDFHPK